LFRDRHGAITDPGPGREPDTTGLADAIASADAFAGEDSVPADADGAGCGRVAPGRNAAGAP
jgi:hypothetical protein